MADRRGTFELVESFHLAQALFTLRRLGVLETMREPASADDLASAHGLDACLLRGTLELLAERTTLVRRTGHRFSTTGEYSPGAEFVLEQYVGAYGRNAAALATSLRDPASAVQRLDQARHARAFEAVADAAARPLAGVVRRLGLDRVLELGCGPGALLIDLARGDDAFVGWGVDRNRFMCAAARRRARAAGVAGRVHVLRGDCFALADVLPGDVAPAVRAVVAQDVVNELCADGGRRIVAWLRGLADLLPGRLMLVSDYYGRLGTAKRRVAPETLLHDYIQLISGQGIPPGDLAAWGDLYDEAGCHLVHAIEDRATTRFVHVLVLPGEAS